MRFSQEKKNSILIYTLEKISEGTERLSDYVANTFGISQNTAHSYINELVAKGIIRRVKRGSYELVTDVYNYRLNRSSGDLDNDTDSFHSCLEPHIEDLPENVRQIWNYAFSEMINNVMDHSAAETADVQIIRDYLNTTVIIKDDGVGIFEKIKSYFQLSSLDDVICELFKGKLTTDTQNHSGEGIFFTSRMMDRFFIVSGGKVFSTDKFEDDLVLNLKNTSWPGTCVIMTLSNFSQKQAAEVFDQYSDDDGGFTKTSIPLKNLFDSAPVSRSQAKRLCKRLERFSEVILDFKDLTWMGQGFAHQLFVVYPREHPDTKLIPKNMSESVEKMFRHVTAG